RSPLGLEADVRENAVLRDGDAHGVARLLQHAAEVSENPRPLYQRLVPGNLLYSFFPPGPQPRLLGKSGGPCPARRRHDGSPTAAPCVCCFHAANISAYRPPLD